MRNNNANRMIRMSMGWLVSGGLDIGYQLSAISFRFFVMIKNTPGILNIDKSDLLDYKLQLIVDTVSFKLNIEY